MRTTLTIDDDVLAAARALAARDRKSLGAVISALSREGLKTWPQAARHGITLLPAGRSGRPVTLEWVNQLRDELP